MGSDSYVHTAPDGAEIVVHRWAPEETPRGLVVIAHGMGEHGLRYSRFAEHLRSRGFLVVAPDHRGHGRTAKSARDLGHFADENGFERLTIDLRHIAQGVRREHPLAKLILFGHSLGSYLCQTVIVAHPQEFDGLILSGTDFGGGPAPVALRQVAKLERMRLGKRGHSSVIRELTFGQFNRGFEGRTHFDWLSRDASEVDAYLRDPLCGFAATTQSWFDLSRGLTDMGRLSWARLVPTLPILLLWGSRDPVTREGKGPRKLGKAMQEGGLTRVTLREYAEGRHEMLNETNRSEVMSDVAEWLETATSLA